MRGHVGTNDYPYEASVEYGAKQQRLPRKVSEQKQHARRERLANAIEAVGLKRPKDNKNSK